MTCIEKYISEHPNISLAEALITDIGCPDDFGYVCTDIDSCTELDCASCWNREIPEEKTVLTPCPICGGKVKTIQDGDGYWKIICTECPVTFGRRWFDDEPEVVEEWNGRIGRQ